ncbi:MAG TPA: hypothetical protein VN018_07870 [Brevundimonas sp.]|nr:hypothetical protein [Brevundimonas sp.]
MTPLAQAVAASQEAERTDAHALVMELLDATAALETLTEDLFTIMAEVMPDRVAQLRDQAAASFQRSVDRTAAPDALGWPGFWQKRWQLLEGVMVSVGQPYEGAEVVNLSEVRASKAAPTGDT